MVRWVSQVLLGLSVLSLIGCAAGKGSSGGNPPTAPQPNFSIGALSSITVTPNSTQTISILVTGTNGFSSPVNFTISGMPAGISVSPATFTLTPGTASSSSSETITITASISVTPSLVSLTVTATSGSITQLATTPTGQADFALVLANPKISLMAGSSTSLSISSDAFNGFTGQVSVSVTGLPQGVTASPSSLTITPGVEQTVTLTAAAGSQPATATIVLQGTSGSVAHNLQLLLAVSASAAQVGFSLSVSPGSITLQAGGSAQPFMVAATALNGFTGTIDVTLSGLPNGVAVSPSTFTLTPGARQQILLNAASTEAAGTSTLTIQGTSGSIVNTAQLQIVIQPVAPNFSLSLSPASISLPIGGAAQQVSITANAVGNFSSPVEVTLSGLPAGVTATPSTLTLTPGSAQSISLQASSTSAAGQASVTIQGTSGSLTQLATLPLTVAAPVPDFQLFAGPSTLNLSTIADQSMTVALIPLNGFSAPATVTISGLPPSVTITNPPLPLIANLPQTIGLSAVGATPENGIITLTATAGTITHTAQVNVVVSAPSLDFTPFFSNTLSESFASAGLLLTPGTFEFEIGLSNAGGSAAGTTVQLAGLVPGTGLDQSQYTFTSSAEGLSTGVFTITITAAAVGERGVLSAVFTGEQISHEVDFPIYVVAQPTIFSYIAPLTIRQGAGADLLYEVASTSTDEVQLYLGSGWPQGFWLNPFLADSNPELTQATYGVSEIPGTFSVSAAASVATGATTLPFEFAVDSTSQVVPVAAQIVPFTDFSVAAEPQTIALAAGGTQTVTVSAAAVNGFSSPVNVSMDSLPAGVQASPQAFTLEPGNSQAVTLTTGSTYSAGGLLRVDASSGDFAHSTQVAVSPGSFTGDLAVTGNTFSGLGIAQIYTSGTYGAVTGPDDPSIGSAPYFVPDQAQPGSATSNCGGVTTNSNCTPVNIALWDEGTMAVVLNQPGTLGLQANFGGGTQYAVLPFVQILPDYTLNFSPSSLTIPAGGSAALSVTYSPISSTFTQYCYVPFSTTAGIVDETQVATITAPPPLGPIPASLPSVQLCNPEPVTISVPANVPPGNYELTVSSQFWNGYQPYFDPGAFLNPIANFYAAHTYGVPITVTAAP